MANAPVAPAVRLIYRGKHLRTSFFWFSWFLLFGAAPLAVYVSTPEHPVGSLLVSLILGAPAFVYSLVLLGKYQALIIAPSRRRLRFVVGVFHRSRFEELDYGHVESIEIVGDPDGPGGAEQIDLTVAVKLQGGQTFLLAVPDWKRAHVLALELSAELAVPAFEGGKKLDPARYFLQR